MKKVSNPLFWDQRYIDNNIQWDLGKKTPIVTDYLKNNDRIGDVCIFGCGNGYDAIEFSKYGNNVYAVDFSIEAITNLKRRAVQKKQDIQLVNKDIFDLSNEYSNSFDMIFEYTCFCAINPDKREEYFNTAYDILKKDGLLFGIFLPFDKKKYRDGPPFGITIKEIKKLSKNKFKIIENYYSDLSVESRKNREKVIILKKNK